MTKNKSKRAAKKPSNHATNANRDCHENHGNSSFSRIVASIILGGILSIVIVVFNSMESFHLFSKSSFLNKSNDIVQQTYRNKFDTPFHENKKSKSRRVIKEAFLQWFVDNGGIFHPIKTSFVSNGIELNDADGAGNYGGNDVLNVTVEEFPTYGGWGLALSVPSTLLPWNDVDDNRIGDGKCRSSNTEGQCLIPQSVPKSDQAYPKSTTIIKHLDPLFTVPPSIILSVQSVLDIYDSPSSPFYLPTFYSRVNQILKQSFPDGAGLMRGNMGSGGKGMGLVEQDVVIAMYLMAEECHHQNVHLFSNQGNEGASDSHWGPYLDILPQYVIPRLDTFVEGEYATLNDEKLEYAGRNSKRLLKVMYLNDEAGSDDNTANIVPSKSLKSVVRDMIRAI